MVDGNVIQVDGLKKTYKSGLLSKKKVEALKEVSFSVAHGTVFGLLGPNGAGKTTLIKILLGIVRKSGGNASLLGRPAGDRRGREKVGYLPENHRIPRHLTASTAMLYYGGLSNLAPYEVRERASKLLSDVGLAGWEKTSVKKFSKGMLQRLGLAQAMLHEPDALILDEPTDGVDPVGRTEMRQMLTTLKEQGKTIFINSHLLQEVELVCDRVAVLVGGILRREGTVAELTAMTQTDVARFTLRGNGQHIATVLANAQFPHTFGPPDQELQDRIYVEVGLAGQPEMDRCIDVLRQNQIGVAEVWRPKMTLEDAFMRIVQQTKQDGTPNQF